VLCDLRDGDLQVTPEAVTLILNTLDQLKTIISVLEETGLEPEGDDAGLIAELNAMATPVAQADTELDDDGMIDLGPPAADDHSMIDLGLPAVDDILLETMPPMAVAEAEADTPEIPADTTPDAPPREIAAAAQNIRVSVNLLENLMTMVSELVLTRNQLMQTMRNEQSSAFTGPLQRLNHITSELQEGVMKTRMQPIGKAWNKLPRIVRDLSQELDKQVNLEMFGAETELDRQVLEMIKDPLTHMVRNSCDHGLESGAERLAAGKPESGRITLQAAHEGGHIVITISDDGKGLDLERIKSNVLEKGLASSTEIDGLTDQEILQYIFKPGFSTASAVTNVSGRGVGMDVVRTNIERIGGAISLQSTAGLGMSFSIKIPLTLAIVAALIVEAGGQRFAIPQISVLELVRASASSDHRIEHIDHTPVLRLRDRLLPLLHLGNMLELSDETVSGDADSFIVVAQVGNYSFGIVVDEVFDTEEIVVKPVAPLLRKLAVFSGNTILGDGSVVMILDPNGLAENVGAARVSQQNSAVDRRAPEAKSSSDMVSLLVFNAGDGVRKAAPLSLIARLEEMAASDIEIADGRLLAQYRDSLMPLTPVYPELDLHARSRRPIIVFNDGPRWAGLIVDEIIDIVEQPLIAEIKGEMPGVMGAIIVDGQSTELIDTAYYLTRLHSDWFATSANTAPSNNAILVIDDSPFFRHLLSPLLQQAGYAVTSVESAERALDLKASGAAFDLIVSDIEMPGMDGFTFAETVKSSPEWGHIPLIALSGKQNVSRLEQGRISGFTDYVGKTDREGLLATLSSTLESAGGRA